MIILFLILLIAACAILGLIVLIQNPKGGGLSGSIAGFNNQFMGVKQTTDVLEKGTWIFAAVVGVLCIISSLFFKGTTTSTDTDLLKNINTTQQTAPATTPQTPANTVPLQTSPDTSKH